MPNNLSFSIRFGLLDHTQVGTSDYCLGIYIQVNVLYLLGSNPYI